MTIKQAIEKAIEGGWVCKNEWGSSIVDTPRERILIDPLFWQSLYGSEKYGRIKAIEFINAIFDGKSAEKFFEQESDLGKEQQEKALS